jgi:hypothetical protein
MKLDSNRRALALAAAAGLGIGLQGCKSNSPGGDGATPSSVQAPANVAAEQKDKDCCIGKNECKGKGGCAVPESHSCAGKNECKGKGGCNMHCPK